MDFVLPLPSLLYNFCDIFVEFGIMKLFQNCDCSALSDLELVSFFMFNISHKKFVTLKIKSVADKCHSMFVRNFISDSGRSMLIFRY